MIKWPELWIVSLHFNPDRRLPRIIRAHIEVDRRADTRPLRAAIEKILTNEPGSEKDPFVAELSAGCLLCMIAIWTPLAALRRRFPRRTLDAGFNR